MRKKYKKKENDVIESLYFGNDIVEITERQEINKLFNFGNHIAKI